jgi:Xaa-Pro dipeptidase
MPSDEYPNRVARARNLMRKRGIDCLIVTDPVNYSYFTGHKVALSMRSRPAIFILPLNGAPALIAWSGPDMFARLYKQSFPSWVEDRRIYPEVPFTPSPRVVWGCAAIR